VTLASSGPSIGNAPISYGVFGATAGAPGVSPGELLAGIAQAGYAGCELGPPGFFGTPNETAAAFAAAGLEAVGAYVPIHFTAREQILQRELSALERSARELVACGGQGVLILADEGSDALLRAPVHDPADPRLTLDAAGWRRFAAVARRAQQLAVGYGLATSFHPHISTYVERPSEIEAVLESTELSLTLDTGHLLLAGADPLGALRLWRPRVNHVHVKDVRLAVLERARAEGRTDFDSWWARVCVPLGVGDVALEPFLNDLVAGGYDGWLVVEQDRAPTSRDQYAAVAEEQRANLRFVHRALGDGDRFA